MLFSPYSNTSPLFFSLHAPLYSYHSQVLKEISRLNTTPGDGLPCTEAFQRAKGIGHIIELFFSPESNRDVKAAVGPALANITEKWPVSCGFEPHLYGRVVGTLFHWLHTSTPPRSGPASWAKLWENVFLPIAERAEGAIDFESIVDEVQTWDTVHQREGVLSAISSACTHEKAQLRIIAASLVSACLPPCETEQDVAGETKDDKASGGESTKKREVRCVALVRAGVVGGLAELLHMKNAPPGFPEASHTAQQASTSLFRLMQHMVIGRQAQERSHGCNKTLLTDATDESDVHVYVSAYLWPALHKHKDAISAIVKAFQETLSGVVHPAAVSLLRLYLESTGVVDVGVSTHMLTPTSKKQLSKAKKNQFLCAQAVLKCRKVGKILTSLMGLSNIARVEAMSLAAAVAQHLADDPSLVGEWKNVLCKAKFFNRPYTAKAPATVIGTPKTQKLLSDMANDRLAGIVGVFLDAGVDCEFAKAKDEACTRSLRSVLSQLADRHGHDTETPVVRQFCAVMDRLHAGKARQQCERCHVAGAFITLKCPKCPAHKVKYYCSKEHQKQHWNDGHDTACKGLKGQQGAASDQGSTGEDEQDGGGETKGDDTTGGSSVLASAVTASALDALLRAGVEFAPCVEYAQAKKGYQYREGTQGLGYYLQPQGAGGGSTQSAKAADGGDGGGGSSSDSGDRFDSGGLSKADKDEARRQRAREKKKLKKEKKKEETKERERVEREESKKRAAEQKEAKARQRQSQLEREAKAEEAKAAQRVVDEQYRKDKERRQRQADEERARVAAAEERKRREAEEKSGRAEQFGASFNGRMDEFMMNLDEDGLADLRDRAEKEKNACKKGSQGFEDWKERRQRCHKMVKRAPKVIEAVREVESALFDAQGSAVEGILSNLDDVYILHKAKLAQFKQVDLDRRCLVVLQPYRTQRRAQQEEEARVAKTLEVVTEMILNNRMKAEIKALKKHQGILQYVTGCTIVIDEGQGVIIEGIEKHRNRAKECITALISGETRDAQQYGMDRGWINAPKPSMMEPQDEWCCPITLDIMQDPYLLAGDGHTYEKVDIQAWIAQKKAAGQALTSPKTSAELAAGGEMTFPNMALRTMIRAWIVKHHQQEYVPWWDTRTQ